MTAGASREDGDTFKHNTDRPMHTIRAKMPIACEKQATGHNGMTKWDVGGKGHPDIYEPIVAEQLV